MQKNFKLLIILFFILNFSVNAEELNFRGSSGSLKKVNAKINISKSMLNINNFNEISKKFSGIKTYARAIDATGNRKPRKFRGGGDIYEKLGNTVVFIGNYEEQNTGSGFLIDQVGLILTNWHVVKKAEQVAVWTLPDDGTPSESFMFEELSPMIGAVVARNELQDLAIIKVSNFPQNIKPVNLGSLRDVRIGDKVYAIGHPANAPWTFSEGIINQIRKKHKWTYADGSKHQATLIQTQTPINPGNSGGPLFSDKGKLIGINTLQADGQNLNFAVAVEHAK